MQRKIKTVYVMLILALSWATPLFAQHFEELYSPLFLSAGLSAVPAESVSGDTLNPAASGLEQRTTVDLSYINLSGFGDDTGMGHAGNFGLTIPTKVGVFSGSAHFLTSPFGFPSMGTLWGFNLSIAKDLFPNFLVGAGISSVLGGPNDYFDWSLGLDIGFIHLVGDLGLFKDFRWGIAMYGIGKWYTPQDNETYFPASFTPALGVSFKLIKTDNFSFGLAPNIMFPMFQDVQLYLGAEFVINNTVYLYASLNWDYREFQTAADDRIFFSFGASFRFNLPGSGKDIGFLGISDKGWDKSEIKVNLAAVPLQNGIWGFGGGVNIPLGVVDKNPPKITLTPQNEYISPNLDGTKDNLVINLEIKDERYIKGYKLVVKDQAGNVVRTIINKDDRPENITFQNIIDRLLYVKQGIEVPETLVWDGLDDSGQLVADGTYYFYLESWDDNGNVGTSAQGQVVVDNTPPNAKVAADYLIFSPNSDGSKDTVNFAQSGSNEDIWQGKVYDTEGKEVAAFTWKAAAPAALAWDGKNSEGILLPDGVYSYVLTATDRAGNSGTFRIDNIIIDTQATPININIDKSYFSPNGDNVKDTVVFKFDIPVKSGIESWTLTVLSLESKSFKTFKGGESIPATIEYDGKTDAGMVLSEGTYRGVLNVLYVNGNNPESVSPDFTVDVTPPLVSLRTDLAVFSPNNDGNKDTVTIDQETSTEDLWTAEFKDASGSTVRTISWKGKAASSFVWAGRDNSGALVPDGAYEYVVYAYDRAGNFGSSKPISIEVSTRETPVFLSTGLTHFSPNNDGVKDSLTIIPYVEVKEGIESYEVFVSDKSGKVYKTFKGKSSVPKEIRWDGRDESGRVVPDGTYLSRMSIVYANGNNPRVQTNVFVVDTVYPEIQLEPSAKLFSPDGDGNLDTVIIKQVSSEEELWEGDILDAKGAVVTSYYWQTQAKDFSWEGKDSKGNKIPDGFYTYKVTSTDLAGNKTVKEISKLEIDTSLTPVFLTVDALGFSPNADGFMDTIGFKIYINNKRGIKGWKLDLVHQEKGVVRTFNGTDEPAKPLVWDGFSAADQKEKALEGVYYAQLTVEYTKGNRPTVKTKTFRFDVTAPEIDLQITPDRFSPDNDGLEDELYIKSKVKDLSPIAAWSIDIIESQGAKVFKTFKGDGVPTSTIVWNGLSNNGELVLSAEDYPLKYTISDDLGNTRVVKGLIPVDILVIKMGDKLKIQIPSIIFAAGQADYLNGIPKEEADKNLRIIKRLAEIFKKYSEYNIRIEGHALNFYWDDPARAAKEDKEVLLPLSKKRAEVIKKALVEQGIDASRITTEGYGSSQPIVPFSDLENRWKNRRVEFILVRKS